MSVEKLEAAKKLQAKSGGWRAQALQLAAVVLAVFVAKGALAEPFYVPSGSMEPTLLIGDALLASKFPYGYGTSSLPIQINLPETGRVFEGTPKRGDVVVFRWPGDRSQAWVKRVVGLPGDRIQMRQGQLFINNHAASLKSDGTGEAEDDNGNVEPANRYVETLPNGVSHAIFKIRDNGRLDNTPEVTVPPGQLFASGCCRWIIWSAALTPWSARGISACAASRSGPGCPVFGWRGFLPRCIEHNPEKWEPVFRKDHAHSKKMSRSRRPSTTSEKLP
jgi:signal peptidase I